MAGCSRRMRPRVRLMSTSDMAASAKTMPTAAAGYRGRRAAVSGGTAQGNGGLQGIQPGTAAEPPDNDEAQ